MNIKSLKFISESSRGIIYEVQYETKGNWFNRSEEKTIKVFVQKGYNTPFYCTVKDYNTGETLDIGGHLFDAIVHDYELNVKSACEMEDKKRVTFMYDSEKSNLVAIK
jgi:hypothetical protein